MSFPSLVLLGNDELTAITDIQVVYSNDTSTPKPARLTRTRYDIKRQMQVLNVSGATSNRYPDIPYNASRSIRTWQGYIDVTTGSVAVWGSTDPGEEGSTTQTNLNVSLIQQAVVLKATEGVNFTLPVQNAVGPDNPSLELTYEEARQEGINWLYKITSNGAETPTYTNHYTDYWMIKDINITDHQNGTSRVNFHFEFIGIWQSIADIIDDEDV